MTIELPDALFRSVKAAAPVRGQSLKEFFAEAVQDRLRRSTPDAGKPWEQAFGGLRDLHRETRRIQKLISAKFETIDEEQWR